MTLSTKCETEMHSFFQQVLGKELPTPFYESLVDGITLLEIYKHYFPGQTTQIHKPIHAFKMRENLFLFIEKCRNLGVEESDLFVTEDLFEKRYINVEMCILAFLGKVNEIPKYKNSIPKKLLEDPSIPENPYIPVIRTPKDIDTKSSNNKTKTVNKCENYCFGEIDSSFKPPKLDIHANLPRQVTGNFAEYSGPNKSKAQQEYSGMFYEAGETFKPPKIDIHADLPRQIKGDFKEDSGPDKIKVEDKENKGVKDKTEDK
ncbi:Calponin-2 [Cucumispora dikerogammari]|nr:Calponin-2 [Cucumispora dikerogammari]